MTVAEPANSPAITESGARAHISSPQSTILFLDELLTEAASSRASDIHIDPVEEGVCIRYRIDGVMREVRRLPRTFHATLISRVKILSSLRTDEHYAAQDGRFRVRKEGSDMDVRVSIAPTFYGENAVLRLLLSSQEFASLSSLGLLHQTPKVVSALELPHGLILVTGPTGSGKTTTLYSFLRTLNRPESSVVTIEDPIEYAVPGVEQIPVHTQTGLTFAAGLKSILRQDPDVIMVGEIRDRETAGMAVQAALTGHLVLSTLHTNNAATALIRLLDMQVEHYLVASTVGLIVGQRLVRKICAECRIKKVLSAGEAARLLEILPTLDLDSLYEGAGCRVCIQSGYVGRLALFEVLVVDRDIREAVLLKASARELNELAVAGGMSTLLEDGLEKAKHGETTISEVLRLRYE